MHNWLIDTHCHLTLLAQKTKLNSLAEVLACMEQVPPVMIHVACHPDEFQLASQWIEADPRIYGAFGVHPHDASLYNDSVEEDLSRRLMHPKVLAAGEMGLDYHYDLSPRPIQQEVFRRQLDLAIRMNKPVVLHTREAEHDTLAILQDLGSMSQPIHVHCYTGGLPFAKSLLNLNLDLYFGFTGILTFKNADEIREVVQYLPADRILTETDSPFLAPVPFRGKTATPEMVIHVVQAIAALRKTDPIEQARQCRENARRFYGV